MAARHRTIKMESARMEAEKARLEAENARMEAEQINDGLDERKCVVITKESVFYVPDGVQLPESPNWSLRHQTPCTTRKTWKTNPSTDHCEHQSFRLRASLLTISMVMLLLALLAVLGVLLMEYRNNMNMNATFCVLGVLLGLSSGWFVTGCAY